MPIETCIVFVYPDVGRFFFAINLDFSCNKFIDFNLGAANINSL
jgi:hypothetical protein